MTDSESIDDLVEFWHRVPTVLLDDAAREVLAKIEGRVRAEVAEEIARALDARGQTERRSAAGVPAEGGVGDRFYHSTRCVAFGSAAKIARLAAGSSPDTTPTEVDHV